jgi:hypothetical protein
MKRIQFICLFFLIVSNIAVAQQLNLRRPNIVGRWLVIESWDMTLNDRLEIVKTNVLRGFDHMDLQGQPRAPHDRSSSHGRSDTTNLSVSLVLAKRYYSLHCSRIKRHISSVPPA